MSKLSTARKVIVSAVTISVGYTIDQMIKKNAPTTKLHQKVMVAVGAFVIADMIASRASAYFGKHYIDEIVEKIKEVKKANSAS